MGYIPQLDLVKSDSPEILTKVLVPRDFLYRKFICIVPAKSEVAHIMVPSEVE